MSIDQFRGKYRFLSNFAESPITYNGLKYPTVEHIYQAYKVTDMKEHDRIRFAKNAFEAKKMGAEINSNGKRRPDWYEVNLKFMEIFVREKFKQNDDLRMLLLDTGDEELTEGNNWNDTFWGVCNGVGENHLGKILMKIRQEFRDAQAGKV